MPSQSLQGHLTDQLVYLDTTLAQLRLLRALIAHINDNGYLDCPLDDIFQEASADELEKALGILQTLDPAGIGARDIKECLLLQATPRTPHGEIVRTLIRSHLEDIQGNRLSAIQRLTGFDEQAIREAIEILKHFHPRPGRRRDY